MDVSKAAVAHVRRIVWRHYRTHGRHDLPWRQTTDPYKILVSEVMLQQTQVARVVPKYEAFVARFPTVQALAAAPLREVLVLWSGLGYNRRARMLHEAAKWVCAHGGAFPRTQAALQQLPGVGHYTAGAVCAFAYNQCVPLVETNIRTVCMHHLLPGRDKVPDAEILQLTKVLCPRGRAREWYWALMDYGAHLKEQGVRLNAKSKHYTKQSRFAGSDRQLRGAIVRVLTAHDIMTQKALVQAVQADTQNAAPERIRAQLERLVAEGMVMYDGRRYRA